MAKRKAQRASNLPRILIFLGIFFILLGLLTQTPAFFRFLMTFRERPSVVFSYQAPTILSIPSQKIRVNVDEGGIIDGEWVLSGKSALYLPTSGRLGEGYNTIIYAHNTPELFANLGNLTKGDRISIKDKAGIVYKYEVTSVENVKPTDLEALYSGDKNVLTLFTCNGWADTSRTVVKARLL